MTFELTARDTRALADTWERAPLVLERPFAQPIARADEMFAAAVRASLRARGHDRTIDVRLYLDDGRRTRGYLGELPTADDGSFPQWIARLEALHGDRSFGLVLNHLQVYAPEHWARARALLSSLAPHVGAPTRGVLSDLFVGKYKATPFGLHKDQQGVLTFVVSGTKRMRVWPFEVFRGRFGVREEHRHAQCGINVEDWSGERAGSVLLEGRAGDVMYWPSTAWHVAELDEPGTVSIGMGVFAHESPEAAVVGAFNEEWRHRMASGAARDPLDIAAELASPDGRTAVQARARALALRRSTAGGFLRVPPARPREVLGDEDRVVVDARFPIAWQVGAGAALTVAAAGHALDLIAHPGLIALFERLNRGAPLVVGELVRAHAGVVEVGELELEAGVDELRSVLESLLAVRGLERAA